MTFQSRLRLESLETRKLLSMCTVTRPTDIGAGAGQRGDFRYCLDKANSEPGADVIVFQPNAYGTIHLTRALPPIRDDVSILGPGPDLLTLRRQAGGEYRIIAIDPMVKATIVGITMTNGYGSYKNGGGIHNEGDLTLADCAVTENYAKAYVDTFGGGIYNASGAMLRMTGCLVSGNSVVNGIGNSWVYGGGIANLGWMSIVASSISHNLIKSSSFSSLTFQRGGGVYNQGTLTLDSSTVSENVAWATGYDEYPAGGGIYNAGSLALTNCTLARNVVSTSGGNAGGGAVMGYSGTVWIYHSTIAYNEAYGDFPSFPGGIYNLYGSLHLQNSVVAMNFNGDVYGAIHSGGHNIIGGNPLLGPLQDNGGPTQTIALLPGSPAIDAGDNTGAPEWDQRGPSFLRVVNGTVDIGAFEVQEAARADAVEEFFGFSFPSSRSGTHLPETLFQVLASDSSPFFPRSRTSAWERTSQSRVNALIRRCVGSMRAPGTVPAEWGWCTW